MMVVCICDSQHMETRSSTGSCQLQDNGYSVHYLWPQLASMCDGNVLVQVARCFGCSPGVLKPGCLFGSVKNGPARHGFGMPAWQHGFPNMLTDER